MPSHDIIYEGLARSRLIGLGETYTCSASDALPRETEFTRLLSYDISGIPQLVKFSLSFFETVGWM